MVGYFKGKVGRGDTNSIYSDSKRYGTNSKDKSEEFLVGISQRQSIYSDVQQ